MRTAECLQNFVRNEKEWFIYGLPNLTHLILYSGKLCSIDNQLIEILNKRLQRLDIDLYLKLNN